MRNYMKKVLVRYKILIVLFAVLGVSVAAVPVVLGARGAKHGGWQLDSKAASAIMSDTKLTPNYKNASGTKLLIINNSASKTFFAPTRGANEFTSFVNNRPADLTVFLYCGDGNCQASYGETQDNCPLDCGINIGKMFNWQHTSYHLPWDQRTVGFVCGDGICDDDEKLAGNCPYDCSTGCCAEKTIYTIPNCDIFASYRNQNGETTATGNAAYNSCRNTSGCTITSSLSHGVYNLGDSPKYYGLCGPDKNYVCRKHTTATACNADASCTWGASGCITTSSHCLGYGNNSGNCNADTKCQWDSSRALCVGKTKPCWDNTNEGSCSANPNCVWIGQIDSPHCYNYCGNGIKNSIIDTQQTCPIENYEMSPSYSGTERIERQCGDGVCTSGGLAGEHAKNCPRDCAANFDANGQVVPVNGCGDGICDIGERKGVAGYCAVDCGDIGEGLCVPFNDVCSQLSETERAFTHGGCSSSFLGLFKVGDGTLAAKRAQCLQARNRNECNRYGCYWNMASSSAQNIKGELLRKRYPANPASVAYVSYTGSCGDGVCSIQNENCSNCSRDCGICFRTGFCEGSNAACAEKQHEVSCRAAGCTWTEQFN